MRLMQLFNWEIFAFHHRTGLRLCGAKGRVSGAFALMTNGVFVLSGVMAMRNKLKLRITTEEVSMAKRRIAPVHPGFYLKELLEELNLSQYRLARELAIPAMRINLVVNCKRPLTAELALRLGRYFGQSPRYWMNLQGRYEMDVAEDAMSDKVAREVRPLMAAG
jgi:addiction module HigA family antidote